MATPPEPPAGSACNRTPSHLKFAENKGQWEDFIQYRADLGFGSLYLETDRLTFFLIDPEYTASHGHEQETTSTEKLVDCHAYHVNFLNSSPQKAFHGYEKEIAYENYFLGSDAQHWASHVGQFKRVVYSHLYDQIDFQTYGTGGNVKYDFIVHPGGDISDIQLEYEGVDRIFLQKDKLHVVTSVSDVIEQEPYAYQLIDGQKIQVPCKYTLTGQQLGFRFPKGYDKNYELIIDPTLVFASYTGSLSDNWGFSATFDFEGHLYGAGASFYTGYPITTGAFQKAFGGGITDIAISKFTAAGDQLIYSTYLGGNQAEIPQSLIVNNLGQLIVLGTTSSTNFPTTSNAYDQSFNGGSNVKTSSQITFSNGSDIILSIFSESGDELIASTFIGGSGNDGLNIIAFHQMNYGDDSRGEVFVDADNNILIGSVTYSTDFPVTAGTLQPTAAGGKDGCVVKLAFDLSSIIWSTYLGGVDDDAAFSLKVGTDQNIYVCGFTQSSDFPTTSGTIHPGYMGGNSDGFLAKINPTGTQLLASTFLGTADEDRAYFLDFDNAGDVYVAGQSKGGQYPVTAGTFSNAGSSQFIHKLRPWLSTTVFSTIFGNGNGDRELSPSAFMVDVCDRIYFSGWGGKTNHSKVLINGMPLTSGAIQTTTDGSDFYFAVFKPNATDLEYATYFGGGTSREHVDGGTSRFDKTGTIYQAVCAGCGGHSDFPTTPGAYSNTNNASNCNLGVIKFNFEQPVLIAKGKPSPDFSGCVPFNVSFLNQSVGATDYYWDFGDGTTSTEATPTHTYNMTGNYKVMLVASGIGACNGEDTTYMNISALINNETHTTDKDICQNEAITLSPSFPIVGASYEWNNGSTQFSQTVMDDGVFWVKTSLANCVYIDTFHVTHKLFGGSDSQELTFCEGSQVELSATTASDNDLYQWQDGVSTQTITATDPGVYWVKAFSGTCVHIDSFQLIQNPSFSKTDEATICYGDSVFWGDQYYYSDTLVTYTFSSVDGCDSLVNLAMTVHFPYKDTSDIHLCTGTPFSLPDGTTTTTPGWYHFELTTAFGCDSIKNYNLSYFDRNHYLQIIEDDFAVQLGYSKRIHLATDLADSLHWEPAIYLDCDSCLSVKVTPFQETEYFVSSIDQNGCLYVDSITVFVDETQHVYIPNAFSPNNDGRNDLFQIYTDNGVKSINYLRIFDRWGNLVYEGKDMNPRESRIGWDGRFHEKEMNPAVFVYVTEVLFLNGRTEVYSGDLTLIR